MKKLTLLVTILVICYTQIKAQEFSAARSVQSASIILNGNIDKVFPLFTVLGEKRWEKDWNPAIIFPSSGNMEEGLIFQTPDHVHGAPLVTWVVVKYDVKNHQLSYCLTSSLRVAIISISCTRLKRNSTKAEVSYQLTGLNKDGNELSHHMLTKIFANNLKDWETAINNYLVSVN